MKKKKHRISKRIQIFLFVISSIVFFAGCGEEKQEKTEITVIHGWGSNEKDHIAMRQIYEDFEKENPDIDIHLVSMPTSRDLIRKVGDLILVGEMPDVIFFGGTGNNSIYYYMLKNHLAVDFVPYIKEDLEFSKNISPSNLEAWTTLEGKLYTIADTLLLSGGYWYNKDIFREAGIEKLPESWSEFLQVCGQIEDWSLKNGKEIRPLQVSAEGYLYLVDHMFIDAGRKEADIKKWENIGEEDFGSILDTLKTIYRYSFPDNKNYSYRDEKELFNEGKLAICINGVWGAPMIDEKIDAEYALIPTDGTYKMSCESAGVGYVVGKTGDVKREEAGVRFVKYMVSNKVQERILKETEQVPVNSEVSIEKYNKEMPRFFQATQLVKGADVKIETPDNLWESNRKNAFQEHILELLSGQIEVNEFLELLR